MDLFSQTKNRGYWKVAGQEYGNKVQAILEAQRLNLDITDISFHYNDTWWDQHDWAVEPHESLDELYLRRARQLRDQYDTLILKFSGGADSVNILKTFVDNKIKLDVIAIFVWGLGDPEYNIVPNNIEKVKLAFPLLKQLQEQGTEFKVIVSDTSPTMKILGNDLEWFLKIDAPRFSFADIMTHQLTDLPEYEQCNNPGTASIIGVDKPQVWCKDDKIWYFKIYDVLHTMHSNSKSNRMVREPFYWTADMPEIPIKQSHILKQFYRHRLDLMAHKPGDHHKHLISIKPRIIPLIYPKYFSHVDVTSDTLPYYDMTTDGNTYRIEQGLGSNSPRGMGIDRLAELSPYYKIWKDGIDHADSMIDQRFKEMDTIWKGGLNHIYTKPRWLGK